MKKLLTALLVMAAVGIATIGLVASEYGEEADVRERGHEGKIGRDDSGEHSGQGGGPGAAYLSDPAMGLYESECGSCHMAYPPSLLPAASWQLLMSSLGDHFGDNAELDGATAGQIAGFLAHHAAGNGRDGYAEGIWRSTQGQTPPLRITETDYFRGQHHEIPARMLTESPAVGSFARCDACHGGAARGDFDERRVRIPGHGRWDD